MILLTQKFNKKFHPSAENVLIFKSFYLATALVCALVTSKNY